MTVHGRTIDELTEASAGVRSAAASVLLDLQPATFRHHHGCTTTLPLGADSLGMRRIIDTDALAAAFPLASADLAAPAPGQLTSPDAVLYGVNTASAGVLMWNRWAQDNHNSVVLARSGAGKSYFVKLDVLRSLYQGVQVSVIDPEDEYAPLAEHVGGTVIQLGATRRADQPARPARRPPAGHADPARADLAHAHRRDARRDPAAQPRRRPGPRDHRHLPGRRHHRRPRHLDQARAAARGPGRHAQRRQRPGRDRSSPPGSSPWTTGSFSDLFDGPTTARPGGHLVVWSLRHLPDELRTVGTLLALDAIWRDIDTPVDPAATTPTAAPRRRRLVVVDEAWLLMRDGEGARFLFRMSKAARKRSAGLTVVTQDAADVLSTDLGLAVVSNAATQVLMRQSTQSIDAVTDAFGLTGGEARLLLSAPRGEGLLVAGRSRIAVPLARLRFRAPARRDRYRR